MLRLKIELVDVWICHKADLPFAHGDVRLIALKRSWFIAQKLARFQRAALPLVGASSHTIRLTIVGQGHGSLADVWGAQGELRITSFWSPKSQPLKASDRRNERPGFS
jgi:hypothetical protein